MQKKISHVKAQCTRSMQLSGKVGCVLRVTTTTTVTQAARIHGVPQSVRATHQNNFQTMRSEHEKAQVNHGVQMVSQQLACSMPGRAACICHIIGKSKKCVDTSTSTCVQKCYWNEIQVHQILWPNVCQVLPSQALNTKHNTDALVLGPRFEV